MTIQVSPLNWKPYQGGAAGTLVAVVDLDSALDTSYSVPIVGQYNNDQITADVVVCFNGSNNGPVEIDVGPLVFPIDPYTRDAVAVSQSTGQNISVGFTVGSIELQFFKGTPPYNPSQINYAKATALQINKFTSNPVACPAAGGTGVFAHTLGAVPFDWNVYLVNKVTDRGYVPGDTIKYINPAQANTGVTVKADAAAVTVYVGSAGIEVMDLTFGNTSQLIDTTKWNMFINAWV